PSQLRAVAEDSAFLLPSAATLTMSYRRLKCPTAIIAGQDDEIVDSEQAERLQKAMPHAAVTLVPGSRAHGALFCGERDCEGGGGGADGGWSVISLSSPRLLRITLDPAWG